jgi:hypothetical protein
MPGAYACRKEAALARPLIAGGALVGAVTVTPVIALLALKLSSPLYCAAMLLIPKGSSEAFNVRLAEAEDPVPLNAAEPICLLAAKNTTVPLGVRPFVLVTVAVNVIEPVAGIEAALVCNNMEAVAFDDAPSARQFVTRLNASTEPSPEARS